MLHKHYVIGSNPIAAKINLRLGLVFSFARGRIRRALWRTVAAIIFTLIFSFLPSLAWAVHTPEEIQVFNQQLSDDRVQFEKNLKEIAKDPRQVEVESTSRIQRDAFKSLQQRSEGADPETQAALLTDYQNFLRSSRADLQKKLTDLNQRIKKGEIKFVDQQAKRREFTRQQSDKINQFFGQ